MKKIFNSLLVAFGFFLSTNAFAFKAGEAEILLISLDKFEKWQQEDPKCEILDTLLSRDLILMFIKINTCDKTVFLKYNLGPNWLNSVNFKPQLCWGFCFLIFIQNLTYIIKFFHHFMVSKSNYL